MTFFTKSAPKGAAAPVGLTQHGRAGMQMLGSIQKFSSGTLRTRARENFYKTEAGKALAEEHDTGSQDREAILQRLKKAKEIAYNDPMFRLERFFQRYVAEDNFNRGIPAIEERREQFEGFAKTLPEKPVGSLELAPELEAPAYHARTEWHLEPGGWDGYDLYGPLFAFAVGPHVFRHGGYAAVGAGADITQQRLDVIRQLPRDSYERIYEPGCGGVSTLRAVHTVYPDAELIGCDLSPLLLRNGHILAERMGIKVTLKQRDATNTGEPDESVDAVVTYALHHELPPKENAKLFAEMYRILKPGGDIVLSDPPPFRAVDIFHAVILEWDNDHREEPFFTVSCLADWGEELKKAGFVDVESFALGDGSYPWVTRARKPEAGETRAAA
ncbi:MAG TPA: class I SAM-dependent methyltransferase [Pedomonas sp.]|nr:class I SAM-dependent methyltransferase [Pedomonas sp.]